ncbi:MAG: H-NS histone family protein [Sphingobacteriia bacterium]|nr:H-NS histone family protein [Sphingobacteriia bacterium]NCC39577.1 H-NS histone family protein [Gammaproteobacteria bacterium]
MTELAELLAQKEELELQIAEIRKQERHNAIAEVVRMINEHDLKPDDLFGRGRAGTGVLPAKYRDPETGKTWSGKGRVPNWLEGKNRDEFLI